MKWSRCKDRYIGRWYSDTRSVPEGTGYLSGYRKGFRAPLAKDMGLMGQEGKHTRHKGAGAPPHMGWPNWRRKGEGEKEKGNRIPPSPSSLPTPNRNRKGRRSNWEVPKQDSSYLGRPLGCLSSPPTYIYEGGTARTHNKHC